MRFGVFFGRMIGVGFGHVQMTVCGMGMRRGFLVFTGHMQFVRFAVMRGSGFVVFGGHLVVVVGGGFVGHNVELVYRMLAQMVSA